MRTINDLYKYARDNNKPLIFDTTGVVYPTIEGNMSNFLTDYNAHRAEFDRAFWLKYSSMAPIIPEDSENETIANYYNDWIITTKAILYYYLESWARLYYALSINYNPIWNVDGVTTRETKGTTEGLSGSDVVTISTDDHVKESDLAADETEHNYATHTDAATNYEVPYDSTNEKETTKTSEEFGAHIDKDTRKAKKDTFTDKGYEDTHTTEYGKTNEVDYTETETRGGNIGVTMTQTMLSEEEKLRRSSFWDTVYKAICKELLYFK